MSFDMTLPMVHCKTLSDFGVRVFDLLETAHDECKMSLKEIRTKKYIYSNFNYIKRLGLRNISDIVGLTADELGIYTKWNFSSAFERWKTNDLIHIKRSDSKVEAAHTRYLCEYHITFMPTSGILPCQTASDSADA